MKKNFLFLLVIFALSGCAIGPRTITYDLASLAEDHTIGIATNPFSSTGTLLSRIKTFTTETLYRFHLRFFGFPLLSSEIPEISDDRDCFDKKKFNRWLNRKANKPVNGNVRIFLSGEEFFPVLERDIRNAEKYVNLSTYIFDNDQYGVFFADILKEKSKTIPVRIISDMLGCAIAWENSDDIDKLSYAESKNMFSYLTEDSRIKLRKSRNIWLASDHTKMVSIDGKKVYFGGMNIGNEYRYDWRDMMFEVNGDLIPEFHKIFDHAWYKNRLFGDFIRFFRSKLINNKLYKQKGDTKFHVLRTTTYRQEIYNAQIKAARLAKHHIYVENPYIWNETFLYELCAARNRGVDVRVTIPGDFDVKSVSGINKRIANILLKYGVRVFVYPGTSHIKAASFDGWVCFGTANYDDLSLHKNYEVNLSTSDSKFSDNFEKTILLNGQEISSELKESFQIKISDFLGYGIKDYL